MPGWAAPCELGLELESDSRKGPNPTGRFTGRERERGGSDRNKRERAGPVLRFYRPGMKQKMRPLNINIHIYNIDYDLTKFCLLRTL